MIFEGAEQFRTAIADYSIVRGLEVKIRPNESKRYRVKCKCSKCKWLLFSSLEGRTGDFIIKMYNVKHHYSRINKNSKCNVDFLVRKYKERIISQPYLKLWKFKILSENNWG